MFVSLSTHLKGDGGRNDQLVLKAGVYNQVDATPVLWRKKQTVCQTAILFQKPFE